MVHADGATFGLYADLGFSFGIVGEIDDLHEMDPDSLTDRIRPHRVDRELEVVSVVQERSRPPALEAALCSNNILGAGDKPAVAPVVNP